MAFPPIHRLRRFLPLVLALSASACAFRSGARSYAPAGEAHPDPAPPLVVVTNRPAPAADTLVVVTWNVHVGGGDVAALVGDLRSGRLTGAPVRRGFVILLQEAHRTGSEALIDAPDHDGQTLHHDPPTGPRTDVVEVARRLGLQLAYAPAMPNGRRAPGEPPEDRGVAILSDLPLTGARTFELPRERQRRVALLGTVHGRRRDGSEWSLRVATAHLENRAAWSRVLDSFGAARGRQAHALTRHLGDEPVVLGADLNTWGPDFLEPALAHLRRRFPESPESDEPTFMLPGLSRRLDHLFFRLPPGATAEVAVAPDRYGSDHAPVLGLVALGGDGRIQARHARDILSGSGTGWLRIAELHGPSRLKRYATSASSSSRDRSR